MLFFDIDNTLLDYSTSEGKAITQLMAELNLSTVNLHQQWKYISKHYYQKYLAGELSFQMQRKKRIQILMAICGKSITLEKAEELFQDYLIFFENSWCLYDDVIPTLQSLVNRPLGVITNGEAGQQTKKLHQLKIEEFFKYRITSDKVGTAKPDKEVFQYAANKCGVSIEKCIHIGDDWNTDVLGAQSAGMQTIWLNRRSDEYPGGDKSVVEIRTLQEIHCHI